MIRIRLMRMGRKRNPFYRIAVMENSTKRDGRPVDIVGYYNPINKNLVVNKTKIIRWLGKGVKITNTVSSLLKNKKVI